MPRRFWPARRLYRVFENNPLSVIPLALCCLVFFGGIWHSPAGGPSGFLVEEKRPTSGVQGTARKAASVSPVYRSYFASSSLGDHVHSASVTGLENGDLMAVWYAGSREGASDVNIRAARFDAVRQRWEDEFKLVSRETTETVLQRHIRKLGNPVIGQAPDGRLWLFYVSVSMGGWGGSAINSMFSDDGGRNWSTPKRLITSPFLNISTLVRSSPVFHEDGSIGLPIYHEFLGKFPEYLYLDADGRVVDKYRIAMGDNALQPSVVPLDENRAVALLRNSGDPSGRVLASFTHDRGQSWTDPVAMSPWNPNSAIAAVREGDARNDVLVALNDLRDGRFRLSLYEADQSLKHWRRLEVLDQAPVLEENLSAEVFRRTVGEHYLEVSGNSIGDNDQPLGEFLKDVTQRACDPGSGCEFKYEYPSLIRTGDGYFHLVYSWHNTLIKHVSFNQAWLEMHQ